jgi:hypothetical protein
MSFTARMRPAYQVLFQNETVSLITIMILYNCFSSTVGESTRCVTAELQTYNQAVSITSTYMPNDLRTRTVQALNIGSRPIEQFWMKYTRVGYKVVATLL